MSEQTPQLEYGHDAPAWKRRLCRIMGLFLLAAILGVGFHFREPIYRRCRLLYWQRQCLRYTAPADHIVYEDDPIEAAKLLGQGGYTPIPSAATPVAVEAKPLTAWNSYMMANGTDPVIFLHERSINGVKKLVSVRYCGTGNTIRFEAFSMKLFSLFHEPDGEWGSGIDTDPTFPFNRSAIRFSVRDNPLGLYIRFYAGQPDPDDESHFTITYEMSGKKGTIDGWLKDEPHTLEIAVRNGPAK